ncbi:unnamed protein product, partial [marine sediment metagenome]
RKPGLENQATFRTGPPEADGGKEGYPGLLK